MAVFTDPIDFVSLYGVNGLGFLVGDTQSGSDNDRKNAVNRAYVKMARTKSYNRRRSFDYTTSSSPALTAGTPDYDTPTTSGAVFEDIAAVYYRQSGRYVDIEPISDSEWLIRSATRSTDAGNPRFVRLTQDANGTELEFDKPISASFITRIGTITLEYSIRIVHMFADTDQPTLITGNLREEILPVAGYLYALGQNDIALARELKADAELAMAAVRRHDLTRTGRARKIRPSDAFAARASSGLVDYGEL